jgi:hypothetical protein
MDVVKEVGGRSLKSRSLLSQNVEQRQKRKKTAYQKIADNKGFKRMTPILD